MSTSDPIPRTTPNQITEPNDGLHTSPLHDLKIITSEIPEPRAHEVLLRMTHVSICGSDIHFWKHGSVGGEWKITESQGLGHEGAGVVVKLGQDTAKSGALAVGDRVSIEPGIPCFEPSCEQCRIGRYNNCPEGLFYGAPPLHGLLRRYHCHPASWLYKLPSNISNEVGALFEPLSVALHAVQRGNVRPGTPVLVTGAGTIGLFSAMCARAAGAAPIYITDVDENQLKMAGRAVPGVRTVLLQRNGDPKETARLLKDTHSCRPQVVLECSGAPSSVLTTIYCAQPSSTIVLVGVGPEFVELPMTYLLRYEIDLKWVNRYLNTWPAAIRMVENGVLDTEKICMVVRRRLKLCEVIDVLNAGSPGKIVVEL